MVILDCKLKFQKSSPNRNANEDGKTKSESKKSPVKEKKEEKVKEPEKPKIEKKEKNVEPKVKKEAAIDVKKGKKGKTTVDVLKPEDFDDGVWEEVPKKSDKKKEKVKAPEEKKESPVKKNKKKGKDADVEAAHVVVEEPVEVENVKVVSSGPVVDEEEERKLQAQVEELQRVLKAVSY